MGTAGAGGAGVVDGAALDPAAGGADVWVEGRDVAAAPYEAGYG